MKLLWSGFGCYIWYLRFLIGDNVRKKIFFTSDWHLFHENVLKLSNRPFKDIEHMHRVLINNYNSAVPIYGICYFLGDIGFHKSPEIKNVLDQLNGTKILLLGNHDKGVTAMYNLGFDVVLNDCSMIIAKERVTMSHFPLLGSFREHCSEMKRNVAGDNWHGETRNAHKAVPDFGQFHLNGHIHSPNRGRSNKVEGRQYDVGVDANNYRPVSISTIESWIAKTKEIENEEI